ncbi:DnaJ domain-containing protein [Tanacetum coccineum]
MATLLIMFHGFAIRMQCSAQSMLFMHENWSKTSLLHQLTGLAARRKLEDLTIGPVLTVTTEAMLDHMKKLLQIPGSMLLFGGEELENHYIHSIYGAIKPTAVLQILKAVTLLLACLKDFAEFANSEDKEKKTTNYRRNVLCFLTRENDIYACVFTLDASVEVAADSWSGIQGANFSVLEAYERRITTMECNKDEATRAKEIAESKFSSKDLNGAKKFGSKAQNLFPGLEGISQLLAVLDVHVAAENKVSGESDYYGILGAEGAFQLVSQAWNLLSDKDKRLAYDRKRHAQFLKQSVNTQNVFTRVHIPPTQNGFHNVTKSTARAAGADAQTKVTASQKKDKTTTQMKKKRRVKRMRLMGLPRWHYCHTTSRRHLDSKETKVIPEKDFLKISHQIPSYLLTGQESAKAPKGCLNLDPAAIPLEFLHVLADVKEADKMDIDNVSRRE